MNENIKVLEEVLDVLEEEKRKFYNLVSQNEFRIEEINSYLKELSKREDDDFKVFSPRNAENIHREQIEADTSEMKKYQNENEEYHKKMDALKILIDKVNMVIGNLQYFCDENNNYDIQNMINGQVEDDEKYVIKDDEKNDVNKKYENILQIKDNSEKDKSLESIDSSKMKFNLEKKHIAHQILNCVSFIIPDAERAKIELTAISKKLME